MNFEAPTPEDECVEIEGIPCIINPAHALYLHGMEIDWGTGLDARGFVFNNPNASSTCGCGTSFAV
jgi:iron-sulfur cluster assembly protein